MIKEWKGNIIYQHMCNFWQKGLQYNKHISNDIDIPVIDFGPLITFIYTFNDE